MRFDSVFAALTIAAGLVFAAPAAIAAPAVDLWRQVEVIRPAHGVPDIRAENLRAAGYGLAWVMSEDYGPRTAISKASFWLTHGHRSGSRLARSVGWSLAVRQRRCV